MKKPSGQNIRISRSVARIPERKQITSWPRKRRAEARTKLQTVHITAAAAEDELHPVNIEIKSAKLFLRSV